jgi:hypothetical protein
MEHMSAQAVHLCEKYGLAWGYGGQACAVPGSRGARRCSATRRDSANPDHAPLLGACNMHYTVDSTPLLLRAVLRNGPPASGPIGARAVSGLRNVTGRRLTRRTHRDLGRERAADSTQSGLGRWRAEGAADLGVVEDIFTASDHQRLSCRVGRTYAFWFQSSLNQRCRWEVQAIAGRIINVGSGNAVDTVTYMIHNRVSSVST